MDIGYGSLAWKSAHHPQGTHHPHHPTTPRAHTQVALVSPSLSAGSAGKPRAPPSRQTDTRGPGDTSVGACGMLQAPKAGRAAQTGEWCLRRKVERQKCKAHRDHVGTTRIGACGESLHPGGREPRTPCGHAQPSLCVHRVSSKGAGHGLLAGALGSRLVVTEYPAPAY